jgi:hypothetical protein
MIIVEREGQWICVRQPDHARLGGQLAKQWVKPAAMYDGVWRRFVEVVQKHDDGWLEAEARPAVDSQGRPFDFLTLPTHQHIEIWRRSIELAAERDIYQALLVAHHARWLYTNYTNHPGPTEQMAAAGFIGELTQRVVEYMQLLRRGNREDRDAVEPCRMATAATLLSFFDSLSLLLIGALPVAQPMRSVVFNGHQAAIDVRCVEVDASRFLCGPWPFASDSFEVHCPVYTVSRETFKDAGALAGRLAGATAKEKTWRLSPRP